MSGRHRTANPPTLDIADASGLIAEAERLLDALVHLADGLEDNEAAERIIGVAYAVRDKLEEAAAALREDPQMCAECGQNRANSPSRLCPGCEAYREHCR